MDANSDNDASFQVGRRHSPSSSRESSPAAKRQRHALTPTSDDDGLVVPAAHNEDAETPTTENVPLIRQAVGFSWTPSTNANVSTYQASVATQPIAPYFLPGQAPPPPPKPKPIKQRAPRRRKGQYLGQTGKFRLSDSTEQTSPVSRPASLTLSGGYSTSSSGPSALSRQMKPTMAYPFGYPNGNATAGLSNTSGVAQAAPTPGGRRTKNASKKRAIASVSDSFDQSSARPPPVQPSSITFTPPQCSNVGGSSREMAERTLDLQRMHAPSGGSSVVRTNGSAAVSQGSTQTTSRPMRMVTLLIEDVRSGVPDAQLAEVRVPLRPADDPDDGFWGEAVEICNSLQGGPSRIDGPAKVYTMRGRFRQFFMRVDEYDQFEVQPAHLGVSKERTINVFVEAPVPQGQLPRPPGRLPDAPAHNSGSEREAMSSPTTSNYRPTYAVLTREEQMERLAKSNYARPEKRRLTPVSESGSYGHSQRTPATVRLRRDDHYAFQRPLTPPIPGRLADTQEERDEAIANYIRSHIENHPGWIDYMQSTAKPQRVSEVLKQYTFVEERVRELIGRKTPMHWDGAPSCYVEKEHVWRVLNRDETWGEECEETLALIEYYGQNGSRYEDSRVVEMIEDTAHPKPNAMDRFLRLLRHVDESFTQDALRG